MSYVRVQLEGQDSNLHYRVQSPAVCRLTPSIEAGTAGLEPAAVSLTGSRSAIELHAIECGRVESNHHSARRRGYSAVSSPVLSVRIANQGRSAGFEPAPAGITARDAAVTPRPQRGRRDSNPHRLGRQPSALPALSYVPEVARAGVEPAPRAHEAREIAVSPPRKSGRQESNLRSPAPEAGGVATLPHDQMRTPGGTRTRSFRVEGPASSPVRPRGQERKGRESNPQGREAHPFSRRDTAPVAALPDVRCGRDGSNVRRAAFQTAALPLSYGHAREQGWEEGLASLNRGWRRRLSAVSPGTIRCIVCTPASHRRGRQGDALSP